MNNTNQQLFSIYQNINSFYEYRNQISLDDEQLDQASFAKKIQYDKYMLFTSVDKRYQSDKDSIVKYVRSFNEKSAVPTVPLLFIMLMYPGTECETKRVNMLSFINHIRYPLADILIITPCPVSNSVVKGLHSLSANKQIHKNHTFKCFTYSLLSTIIPAFELAPKYTILSDEEASKFNTSLLPKIYDMDPQIVWIGAKTGQVVKYMQMSEITLETIGYCEVISCYSFD